MKLKASDITKPPPPKAQIDKIEKKAIDEEKQSQFMQLELPSKS